MRKPGSLNRACSRLPFRLSSGDPVAKEPCNTRLMNSFLCRASQPGTRQLMPLRPRALVAGCDCSRRGDDGACVTASPETVCPPNSAMPFAASRAGKPHAACRTPLRYWKECNRDPGERNGKRQQGCGKPVYIADRLWIDVQNPVQARARTPARWHGGSCGRGVAKRRPRYPRAASLFWRTWAAGCRSTGRRDHGHRE